MAGSHRTQFLVLTLAALALTTVALAAPVKRAATGTATKPQTGDRVKLVRAPEGGLQPQTAVDSAGTLHLIYFKGEPGSGDIYHVRKAVGQADFSPPLRVNSQPGSAIATGTIRGAQLAVGRDNRVHVAWNGSSKAEPKGPGKSGNPMLYTRLNDGGTAFEPQRNVIAQAYGLDGGGSVAADTKGNVYVVWHGNPKADGEENRRVYVTRSSDDGRTFSPEIPADAQKNGACGCCGLRAFADASGRLHLIYRSAQEEVNRDIYLLTSSDQGGSFAGLRLDTWNTPICPMSNEAFAAAGEAVLAAWETKGQVYFTRLDFTHPYSGPGKPRKPVAPPGTAGGRKHPALAVNTKGETLLVWDEGTGWQKGGTLAWQVFDSAGKPTKDRGTSDGIPVWSFAGAYAEPDGSFVIVH